MLKYEDIKDTFKLEEGELWRWMKGGWWRKVENKVNHPKGYCKIAYKGSKILYHRVVYCIHHKKDIKTGLQIDHINGEKIDNRIENLRLVTSRENQQNRHKHREGRLVGCYWNKQKGKWKARIAPCGTSETIHLGYFTTEEIAHKHYMKALDWKHLLRPNMDKECRKNFREFIKSFFK